jgi:putative transposase
MGFNTAIHLALGVTMAGKKELLGIWITQNESSKFWLSLLTDLCNRSVRDIFLPALMGYEPQPA